MKVDDIRVLGNQFVGVFRISANSILMTPRQQVQREFNVTLCDKVWVPERVKERKKCQLSED
jgi:hypothetical protein